MKSLLRYIFLCIACLQSSRALAGGDSLSTARLADSLFATGNYYVAAIQFQKAAFLTLGPASKLNFTLKASNCYKQLAKYQEGIDLLSVYPAESLNNDQVYNLKYQSALLAYLNRDFTLAESFLIQLAYQVNDSALIYRAALLHVLVLNEQFRWKEAQLKLQAMNRFLNAGNSLVYNNRKQQIDSLYNLRQVPRIKNPEKAARLSTFLPGAGQIYAGYPGEGIFSLAAIGVLASGMAVGVVYQYYFSSVFMGNILIGKFYQGGIKRAEFLTEKRNYLKSRSYNYRLKQVLVSSFQ